MMISILIPIFALPAGSDPARTSPIALSPDERAVSAVDEDANLVRIWRLIGRHRALLEVAAGEEPRTLAFSPAGDRLYVACQRSQTLAVVDIAGASCIAEIPIGGQPYGVILSPDGRRAFVSQYAGGYVDGAYRPGLVAVVDLAKGAVAARIPTRARPWAMALAADGRRLYVTHYLAIEGTGFVTEIDVDRLAAAREIALAEDPDRGDGRGGVFNALASIAIHPGGRRAAVAGMHANARRGAVLSGLPLSHKTTVQAALRIIDLEAGREIPEARIVSSFDSQAVAVPSAVAFIGAGDLYVETYFASSDFKIMRTNERGIAAERALRSLSPGPTGVAVTRDGRTAYFSSRWRKRIQEISLEDPRDPRRLFEVEGTVAPEDEARIRGALLFHETRDTRMTANRWMSCAACHLDGGIISDGLLWDLTVPGSAPKVSNTMDLVNMAGSSPPFFHRGTAAVATALERFVRIFHRGAGFVPDGYAAFDGPATLAADWDAPGVSPAESAEAWHAMLAYIRSLRPRPNPHIEGAIPRPEIRASAAHGRRIFLDARVGCAECHAGPAWTLSGSGAPSVFDVGTGKAVDTPPLLELWDAAPYLHDGRARTLRDVLTVHNRDDRHGRTSHLRPDEIDDLAAFLLAPYEEIR
ncbi:MAG: beta-propeller fold lactonase family protein [Planctomycetes bacterium]|nr:beta-propeller fold lactonase family protein [Planctomycetota bacterium]